MRMLIELSGCLVITFSLIFATLCAFLLEQIIEIWFDKEKRLQIKNPKTKTTIYVLLILFSGVLSAILQNTGDGICDFSKEYDKESLPVISGGEPPIVGQNHD